MIRHRTSRGTHHSHACYSNRSHTANPRRRLLRLEALEDRRLLSVVPPAEPTEWDFGDAPDVPYATLLTSDGPRHAATGPTLGANRDAEPDGQPSAAADGDDITGTPNDEDGVTFGSTIMVGQLDAVVTVNVQNAPAGAKLDAWIDFNGDGSWGGSDERIAAGVEVVEGDQTVSFAVPSFAVSGETYARFRLSTIGSLGPTGSVDDGEVEDYRLSIAPPRASLGVFGPARKLSGGSGSSPSLSSSFSSSG